MDLVVREAAIRQAASPPVGLATLGEGRAVCAPRESWQVTPSRLWPGEGGHAHCVVSLEGPGSPHAFAQELTMLLPLDT